MREADEYTVARPPTEAEIADAEKDEHREASIRAFIEGRDRERIRKGARTANLQARAERMQAQQRQREQQRENAREWFRYHEQRARFFRQLSDEHAQRAQQLIGR